MMLSFKNKVRRKNLGDNGFAIVEVIISVAIAATIVLAFQTIIVQIIKINLANQSQLKATLYLREAIEIAKDLEQSNWSQLISSSNLYPVADGANWMLEVGPGPKLENRYSRYLTIEPAFRYDDPALQGKICGFGTPSSGCTTDNEKTKRVTATIQWNDGFTNRIMTLETLVLNLQP